MPFTDLALFGPGDFSPWSAKVFAQLRRGNGPAVVVSFGVAEMGAETVEALRAAATNHLEEMGIDYVAGPAMDKNGLDDPAVLGLLEGAGLVYVQGGNPRYLVENLRPTKFFAEAERIDVPWLGTSGSAMAAGDRAPDMASPQCVDGLSLRPGTNFAAHWDTFEERIAGFRNSYVNNTSPGQRLIALDEETAIMSANGEWHVFGERAVHVLDRGQWQTYRDGDTFRE